MSGLGEGYGGNNFGFIEAGGLIQPKDIDQYTQYFVFAPSVDTAYIGTVSSATASAAMVLKNALPDYPRNIAYSVTGVAGGMGGTFNLVGVDQFGSAILERVVIGSANGGGTTQGTAIFGSVTSGTFSPAGLGGTAVGTSAFGFGTAAGATGNWFGLPLRIGGTADLQTLTWITTNTATTLNKGTNLGTLISPHLGATTPPSAFQGTSGVAITDRYLVTVVSTWDNLYKGRMSNI